MTPENSSHQISLLLIDWSKGDEYALEQLMPLVYQELRLMARRHMRRQPSGHTFQTTDLIHETYLKIAGGEERNWQSRSHFFGVAAKAMRHILVDYARSKNNQKRGGWQERVTLQENMRVTNQSSKEIVALDEAGRPSFNALQNYDSGRQPVLYYVFDLLMLSGRELMRNPLERRRQILEEEILPTLAEPVQYIPFLNARLSDVIQSVKFQGLEGIVASSRIGPSTN